MYRSFLALAACVSSVTVSAQVGDFPGADFKAADSVASLYRGYSLLDLSGLSEKLTSPFTQDVEKFRAIFTWVCTNVDNDYALYARNKHKREKETDPAALKAWNRKFGVDAVKTLIRDRRTMCTGYAWLVDELCNYAGLNCEVVNGYGRTTLAPTGGNGNTNHSWNTVQLDGKWYVCDATWSSGSIDPNVQVFLKKYDDVYFLSDPHVFQLNHYPDASSRTSGDSTMTLDEFFNAPIIYKGAYRYSISAIQPETFQVEAAKGEAVAFSVSYTSNRLLSNAVVDIVRGSVSNKVNATIEGDKVTINHLFRRKGMYLVHLLINEEYALTWRVDVN